ncbi:major facilitator superfamily domain-containing protein [Durotheca rogersii]|uniref:major facilitator superfamily domain-containing protein n=1 Tax=Durotheca rogersii TaxID=419775 RepID=UPI002221028B|nr:major facilitator superfamily domain-containing protein [Durotheca rogersii]KAI5866396.1 major facilitator superfamily domain-containing protein [Durotheca rogersii]
MKEDLAYHGVAGQRPRIPWLKVLRETGGSGTKDDPYLVTFMDSDPRDPMQFPPWLRWTLCLTAGYVTFSVAFISSGYTSGVRDISIDLEASPELVTLGLSLFLIGFALGPFVWGPTSELFGRQPTHVISTVLHVVLNTAICFSPSVWVLPMLRLLSGAFGAAPLTNSGGIIADTFPPKERGLTITVYALVPLVAPVLGPLIDEYVAGTLGWRWLMGIIALLSTYALAISLPLLPETYTPVILRKRASNLGAVTGNTYISVTARNGGSAVSFNKSLATTLSRPFHLAIREPIVLAMALYQAVVFGTLYLTFAAFPILWDNDKYVELVDKLGAQSAPPETRLPGCCIGGVSIVIGLFWFSGTANPDIHWVVNTLAGVSFGFGIILATISSTNYLVDSYAIFATSALMVFICARAICGAGFPLLVRTLFANLGVFWGISVPAILALLCAPKPFVFYLYGPAIKARCKYADEAERVLRQARRGMDEGTRLLD